MEPEMNGGSRRELFSKSLEWPFEASKHRGQKTAIQTWHWKYIPGSGLAEENQHLTAIAIGKCMWPWRHRHSFHTTRSHPSASAVASAQSFPPPPPCYHSSGNNTSDYDGLALVLKDYAVPTVVVKVSRTDWLRNAAGLIDPNYWRGTLRPRPVLDWYLKKLDEAVSEANELAQGGALSFIGHSAGGWLARVYLKEFGLSNISLLLTLGTPHLPPPKGLPGVIDQTRGLLYYVEEHCPKAVYTPELRYVCLAGRYIKGARFVGPSSDVSGMELSVERPNSEIIAANTAELPPATFRTRFTGQGYKKVCGQADAWGDGVVPVMSAHLAGALNISLDGVYHSPVGSDDETRPWYGSPQFVKQWIHHLLS